MRIGQLAKATGLTPSRIRFYEARGVLPPAVRRENGYRDYAPASIAVLGFIDRGQALGFTLAELGAALAASGPEMPSGVDLIAGLRRKHAELGRHIRDASTRRRQIGALIAELETCEPAAPAPAQDRWPPVPSNAIGIQPAG